MATFFDPHLEVTTLAKRPLNITTISIKKRQSHSDSVGGLRKILLASPEEGESRVVTAVTPFFR